MRFPCWVHADRDPFSRKILPLPIWRQKPRDCVGKRPCLSLKGPKARKNPYLVIFLVVFYIGVCLPYFTNVSARCNTTSTSDVCLVVCPLPSSLLSFVYTMGCALWVMSVQLVHSEGHRGVFLHFFRILVSTVPRKVVYKGVFCA